MQATQQPVTAEVAQLNDVLPLRQRVLRPGRPAQTCHFDGDERAVHFVARTESEVLAIATCLANPHPCCADVPSDAAAADAWWQLRGMAVCPEHQGCGYGRLVLDHALRTLAAQGHRRVWCNARVAARGFYERCGWDVVSEEFIIQHVGPHVVMQWAPDDAPTRGGRLRSGLPRDTTRDDV